MPSVLRSSLKTPDIDSAAFKQRLIELRDELQGLAGTAGIKASQEVVSTKVGGQSGGMWPLAGPTSLGGCETTTFMSHMTITGEGVGRM